MCWGVVISGAPQTPSCAITGHQLHWQSNAIFGDFVQAPWFCWLLAVKVSCRGGAFPAHNTSSLDSLLYVPVLRIAIGTARAHRFISLGELEFPQIARSCARVDPSASASGNPCSSLRPDAGLLDSGNPRFGIHGVNAQRCLKKL